MEFGIWLISQIPNSTLRSWMFIIYTTTSVEFGSNTTDFGQIPQILSGDFGWRFSFQFQIFWLNFTMAIFGAAYFCQEFWLNFKVLSFQNVVQISKFCPNFKILTKFHNCDVWCSLVLPGVLLASAGTNTSHLSIGGESNSNIFFQFSLMGHPMTAIGGLCPRRGNWYPRPPVPPWSK